MNMKGGDCMQQTRIYPDDAQAKILYDAIKNYGGKSEMTVWELCSFDNDCVSLPGVSPIPCDKALMPEDGYTIGYYTLGNPVPAWYITIRRHISQASGLTW